MSSNIFFLYDSWEYFFKVEVKIPFPLSRDNNPTGFTHWPKKECTNTLYCLHEFREWLQVRQSCVGGEECAQLTMMATYKECAMSWKEANRREERKMMEWQPHKQISHRRTESLAVTATAVPYQIWSGTIRWIGRENASLKKKEKNHRIQ